MSKSNFLKECLKKTHNEYRYLKEPKFNLRIKKRDKKMYNELVRTNALYDKFHESDSMERWKDSKYWQIRLINKWNAKEFAKKMNIRVAKLYWNGKLDDFKKFELSSIPDSFIIKPIDGFSSKNVFIINKGVNLFDGKKYDKSSLKQEVIRLYKSKPGLELIIEEFIPDQEGNFRVPIDYKFYMFNGHLEFLAMHIRNSTTSFLPSYYEKDWKLIRNKVKPFSDISMPVPVPKHFEEMKVIAEKLSKEFEIFVRVDLYSSIDGPVFGELTLTPYAGKNYTEYASKRLISAWDKNCKNLI